MTSAGFPGDELIADPLLVIDRHASFAAPPEELWPWIVQIGKGRGGWYMPGWVETVIPRGRRGTRFVRPDLQDVSVGSVGGDWGPGAPEFHAVSVEPPSRLVWLSLRDPEAGHRWPASEAPPWPDRVLAFSWALLLSPDAAGGTHLHVRLRMTKGAWRSDPTFRAKRAVFDFFDWLTIVALFAGLRERLAPERPKLG